MEKLALLTGWIQNKLPTTCKYYSLNLIKLFSLYPSQIDQKGKKQKTKRKIVRCNNKTTNSFI